MICRLLSGLVRGRKPFHFLGHKWDYQAALFAKSQEGFIEGGAQSILQAYIQMVTDWPLIQPIISLIHGGITFNIGQTLSSISFPISILTSILTSTTWHFFERHNGLCLNLAPHDRNRSCVTLRFF